MSNSYDPELDRNPDPLVVEEGTRWAQLDPEQWNATANQLGSDRWLGPRQAEPEVGS
jgi:hypothetical protein